jgi:hypothetical protein
MLLLVYAFGGILRTKKPALTSICPMRMFEAMGMAIRPDPYSKTDGLSCRRGNMEHLCKPPCSLGQPREHPGA